MELVWGIDFQVLVWKRDGIGKVSEWYWHRIGMVCYSYDIGVVLVWYWYGIPLHWYGDGIGIASVIVLVRCWHGIGIVLF